jgi:hypothetical protein
MSGTALPSTPGPYWVGGWIARETVRTLWRRNKFLPPKGIEPRPSRRLVTVLNELSRAFTCDRHVVLSHP